MAVLKNPCYAPTSSSIFSETQNPKFQSFAINDKAGGKVQEFTLNIIDSPGLFEVKDKNNIDSERTNEVIAQTIAKCLENEITYIHCIVMFITFEAGINQHDIEAMKVFLGMFGGSGVKVALCVTHADKHNDEWKAKREQELMMHPKLAEFIGQEQMKVLFMGCVDTQDKIYRSEEDLHDDYVAVYEMRKKMLEFIFSAKERSPLNQMNVAKQKITQVDQMMSLVTDNFKKFLPAQDFGTSNMQQTILQHKESIEYLSQNSIYINVPELTDKFLTIIDLAKQLKAKQMDEKLKLELLWPLKLRKED